MLAALTGVLIGGGDEAERIQEVVAVGDVDGAADGFSYGLILGERPAGYLPLPDSVASAQDNATSISPESIPEVVDAPVTTPIPQPTEVLPLPTVEPAPTEAPSVVESELGGLESLICAYPWSCETALAIVRCESTFDPYAVGAGSYGLFQIQASVHAWKWPDFWEAWSDPVRNTEYAWDVYVSRGYSFVAWSCF